MNTGAIQVLGALRRAPGQMRSGETLSRELGVSRSQVWKHVESLRTQGYGVEGSAGSGYRLSSVPDRLYSEEVSLGLDTRWIGSSIHHFEMVDSTNTIAHELAAADSPHGTVVLAEGQTSGRGRQGRSFYSPPFLNLYLSVVLRPSLTTAECPTAILASAVAVAETIAETTGDSASVEIKWPNDVLLGGRKTSGILMELAAEATRVKHLVLGIGVNINVPRGDFPEVFRETATSIGSFLNRTVDRINFTRQLLRRLESTLDNHEAGGFTTIRTSFDKFFRMAGQSVQVTDFDGSLREGIVLGIDSLGALQLRSKTGETFDVIAGDVTLSSKRSWKQP